MPTQAKKRRKRRPRPKRGEMLPPCEPDWEPLLRLARVYVDEFMWMFAVELEDGTRLEAYKHYWTRRYLHLADDGRAFFYIWREDREDGDDGKYQEIPEEELPRFFDLVIERPDPARGIPRYTYWNDEGDGLDAR